MVCENKLFIQCFFSLFFCLFVDIRSLLKNEICEWFQLFKLDLKLTYCIAKQKKSWEKSESDITHT